MCTSEVNGRGSCSFSKYDFLTCELKYRLKFVGVICILLQE